MYQVGKEHATKLANHLGNVWVTITDKRVYKPAAGLVAYFEVEINSITDYYPFGSVMSGRSWSGGGNRFGFNGQEKEDEINGFGNHNTALFWEYDTRLGRRWNIDPVFKPWESSYTTFLGNPVRIIDLKGDDGYIDEDGNYLGDDGNKESHKTRVISAERWNRTVENKSITEESRNTLANESTLLQEYQEGISISDETWKTLISNGGERLNPILSNQSDKEIFYKPEGTDESKKLDAHKDLYVNIDGVAAKHLKSKKVFKSTNNVRVTVTNNELSWKGDNWIFSSIQILTGGWNNEDWLRELTATEIIYRTYSMKTGVILSNRTVKKVPDLGWINIFKSSGVTNAEDYRKAHNFIKVNYVW